MLARTLGRTVKELQATMDSAEFSEWMLEYRCEPWGEDRADLRMGIFASAMANIHTTLRETLLALWAKGWQRGASHPYTPADFMPQFGVRREVTPPVAGASQVQSPAQLQAFFLGLTQQVGGTVH